MLSSSGSQLAANVLTHTFAAEIHVGKQPRACLRTFNNMQLLTFMSCCQWRGRMAGWCSSATRGRAVSIDLMEVSSILWPH